MENCESDFPDLEGQEFMGNFNAGQNEANMEMSPSAGQKSTMPMTAEELQKLADQEIDLREIQEAEDLPATGLSVADLPRGVQVVQFSQAKYQQVIRPYDRAAVTHTPEEDEKLFYYDEWDFRPGAIWVNGAAS